MIYAAETSASDNSLTVGAFDGELLNTVYAFSSLAAYNAKLDELFAEGGNLIRISLKYPEKKEGATSLLPILG